MYVIWLKRAVEGEVDEADLLAPATVEDVLFAAADTVMFGVAL